MVALNGVGKWCSQFVRFYDQPLVEIQLVTGGPVAGGTLITLGGFVCNFDDDRGAAKAAAAGAATAANASCRSR